MTFLAKKNIAQIICLFFSHTFMLNHKMNIMNLPGSQQSASDGNGGWQLFCPHTRLPLHSLSESQSPWLRPHGFDDEQHL